MSTDAAALPTASLPEQADAARVAFVGAGPGDPGLLTVRARDYLAAADVVVLDTLHRSEQLAPWVREDAEFVLAAPQVAGGKALSETARAKLLAAMPGLKERAKTLVELLDGAMFLFAGRPLVPDAKAAEILQKSAGVLAGLMPYLESLPDWSAGATEGAVRAYAEASGAKLGQVAQPLRAALTGRATSPGIFDVLEVLGRDESLARLRDTLPTVPPS